MARSLASKKWQSRTICGNAAAAGSRRADQDPPRRREGVSPARKAHPAFLVHDLAGLVAKLERAGFAARQDEPLHGFARVYVDDPFGNRIELMEKV
jgi:catechol 2,3-dioxygenase-like lactoylglutathione lyase family enzyme